jgi:homocysteine S-methyltransferase
VSRGGASFREALATRVLVADGAMGSEIYARGVFLHRSYDEVNGSQPELVAEVHRAYLQAGAEVLTTNTFGANRARLAAHGLEDRVAELNAAGVRIARQVAGDAAWVAASMGPSGGLLAPVGRLTPGDLFALFREQADVLADAGPDLFVLETFTRLPELWAAVRAVRSVCDLPIVASMSFGVIGTGQAQLEGDTPEAAAHAVAAWPIDAFGTNCSNGPRGVLELLGRIAPVLRDANPSLALAAMPNAGLPQVVEGRTLYLAAPEYMAEYARRSVQAGASLVGGCCGTTPDMIRQIAHFVRSVRHERPVRGAEGDTPSATPPPPVAEPSQPTLPARGGTHPSEKSAFGRKLYAGGFCVSVELEPPRGVAHDHAVEGARMLREAGVDVVNIADGPRAVARMGPTALAQLVRVEAGMESVVHYCCRDRNLLGMQMDLLGAHALGVRNILAITGDPPKTGTYPSATAVFDIDSIGLISFIQMLNRGVDFNGRPIGGHTDLLVGCGCNPGHVDPALEASRFRRKVEAGAEYVFSQPVFDRDVLFRFLDRTRDVPEIPFLVGIMPLASSRNAEFLHHEVPGMQIPARIRERMRDAGDRDAQREEGIAIAREALADVIGHPRVRGVYVYPPFGSYAAVLRLLDGVLGA